MARIDPLEFERLVADYYRQQGYRVDHSGTGGSAHRYDGGIDLKLCRDGEYTVVQCKRHNAYQVTHNPVHELLGVMLTEGASRAIVITTGEFTDAAMKAAAREERIQLIDGDRLRIMLEPVLAGLRDAEPEQVPRSNSNPDLRQTSDRELELVWEPVGRSQRNGRRAAKDDGLDGLAKFIAAVVVLLMVWQCSRPGPPPPSNSSSRPTAVPVQRHADAVPQSRKVRPAETVTPRVEREMHPARRPPTEQEIRESQRKADEAIRILAPNTPEI
ncbi:MAG: restriction endonuclease [Lysobacter sp.]